MNHSISHFLSDDHRRLEDLLQRAMRADGSIDRDAYWEFRGGLLRHIGIEEKILLREAQTARGGEALPLAARLRLDHGALAALLVLSPTPAIIAAIRAILAAHNPLEEGADGVYAQCERLAAADTEHILERMKSTPAVAMAEFVDSSIARESARAALRRAGYDLEF